MKTVDLGESYGWIVINRKITSITFRWKKLYSYTFKPSLEEVIVMHSENMKAKYMKELGRKKLFYGGEAE